MHNDKEYVIRLNAFDPGRLMDGLEVRARAWRDMATRLRSSEGPSADFVITKRRDAEEAEQLAAHYERIPANLTQQQWE